MLDLTADGIFLRIDDSEMSSERGAVWASLLNMAASELYELIPVPTERRLEILADQIGLEGGEQQDSYGLLIGEKPIAMISAIEANLWANARLASLYRIAGHMTDEDATLLLQRLFGHEGKVEPISKETVYVSRNSRLTRRLAELERPLDACARS